MRCIATALSLFLFVSSAFTEEIGSVSTVFKLLGPNDKIVIEAFDDPKVDGVTCHLSRAKKGGVSGAVGFSTDTSDAAIACRQIGPVADGRVQSVPVTAGATRSCGLADALAHLSLAFVVNSQW